MASHTSNDQTPPKAPSSLPSISFAEAIDHRRSVYALNETLPASLTLEKITALITDTLHHLPSAFNSQTTRCILLAAAQHKKFWALARDTVLPSTPEPARPHIQARIATFEAAYGSIIFAEDTDTIAASKSRNPGIAHMFDEWSDHTSGMHQFVLWTALEATPGVGCNLQHYQFDQAMEKTIKDTWALPDAWKIKAQLVFGGVNDGGWPADAKPKLPTSETLKVFSD